MTQFDQRYQQVETQYNAGRDINVYQPAFSLTDAQRKRNRSRMLQRVQVIWIDGVLTPSIQATFQIALTLQHEPRAVVTPYWRVLQEYNRTGTFSSAEASIVQVYDYADGEVLILGEPGAGKSMLLLELTRDLLERAHQDETHPIPVVFNLSSWAQTRQPLAEWLASELVTIYQVPRAVATSWIKTDQVLPLLDGLDEVEASYRDACTVAINTYRRAHGLLPTVVCCRQTDYDTLSTRLLLHTAVVVQPLTIQQVESYLVNGGEQLEMLHQALQEDADLQALATTPLMLHVLTVAYQGLQTEEIVTTGSPGSKREQIFATYVQRMLARRSVSVRYTPTQTIHCLSWLAGQMKRHNQTAFYLERMQPDWLEAHQSLRHTYRVVERVAIGLVGGLVAGLGIGLLYGLVDWEVSKLLHGLLVGLVAGLLVGLTYRVEKEIKPAEVVLWSWKSMRQKLAKMESLRSGLLGWLIFGLVAGLVNGLGTRLVFGIVNGLFIGLEAGVIVGLVSRTLSELLARAEDKQALPSPGQEVGYSVRNKVLVGLVGGLVVGLVFGLVNGLFYGLYSGLIYGLHDRLVVRLLVGLVVGLLVGLVVGLLAWLVGGVIIVLTHRVRKEVKPRKIISWLRASIWRELMKNESLKYMLVVGLAQGLLIGLVFGLVFGLATGLFTALISGLIFEFISGIIGGLSSDQLDTQILTKPNQGIQRSTRNSLRVGLVGGLLSGLPFALVGGLGSGLAIGLGIAQDVGLYNVLGSPTLSALVYGLVTALSFGLLIALISGLSIGLSNGGAASIQHVVLRMFLWRAGCTPWNYSRFLDYAAERILLRKVGGGYIFLHRLLLDYFAAQETVTVLDKATEGQQASTSRPVSRSDVSPQQTEMAVLPDLHVPTIALDPPASRFETLRSLPCGHEQRSNARFCSVCGAPVQSSSPE